MILALALSVLVGLALGLLGGGGSILTVPILTYAVGMDAKHAIATSLLVVGSTSLCALLAYARRGLVAYRAGLALGATGMLGAFAGGRVAAFVSAQLLLIGFSLLMLASAVAMLRPARAASSAPAASLGRMSAYGAVLGFLTGLLGAGGGFLIVPALVVLGKVPMKRAVGTSLFVIVLNSLAGVAGSAGHLNIDWTVTAGVAAAAIAGSIVGSSMTKKVRQESLRAMFGWLIVAVAVFVLSRALPEAVRNAELYRAVFVTRWPWWIGGIAIAAVVVSLAVFENKQLGVSTGCSELCALPSSQDARRSWRPRFLLGILLGGVVAGLYSGRAPGFAMGSFDTLFGASLLVKFAVLLIAGVLVGFGARLAGGCTSGHGIVGTALGARASWLATGVFMIAGLVTTHVTLALLGG